MRSLGRKAFGILWLLIISMIASPFAVRASDAPVSAENGLIISPWAQESVKKAAESGLVSENAELGSDYTMNLTRLQFACLAVDFVSAEKKTESDESAPPSGSEPPEITQGSFSDTDSPYADEANELGIMTGFNGFFRPGDTLTRAEAASVLQRSMTALEITEANKAPIAFTDTYAIPRWAVQAVKFVSGRTDSKGAALMGGNEGAFSPGGAFTIEQAIITLLRMQDSLSVKDTYPGWRDAPGYDSVSVKLSFGGDCTFGRDRNFSYQRSFDEMYDQMGPDYFFSGISEFFSDDISMVNFEGTLTDAFYGADKTYDFKGRPEYARILKSGSIDVVTVANNHSMDYFQKGYQDTIENLSPYVAVSGYDMMPIVSVKGINIGFASNVGWDYNESQRSFIRNAVQTLRDRGANYIVFFYHWGTEGDYRSNSTQRAIAHYCIDQGADLVIGSHPHVTQETETYNGMQIAYSLGNLVFGGNQNPPDKNCIIYQQTISFDLDSRKPVSETHSAIPYLVSSVSYRNDYHPVPK